MCGVSQLFNLVEACHLQIGGEGKGLKYYHHLRGQPIEITDNYLEVPRAANVL
jgi:hypothetical protein